MERINVSMGDDAENGFEFITHSQDFRQELAEKIWKDIVSQCNEREYDEERGYEDVCISGTIGDDVTYEANVVVNYTVNHFDGDTHMGCTEELTDIEIDEIIFEDARVCVDEDVLDLDDELINESEK